MAKALTTHTQRGRGVRRPSRTDATAPTAASTPPRNHEPNASGNGNEPVVPSPRASVIP